MIVSELKPMVEILYMLKGKNNLFLIGCGDCASACRVGGEDDMPLMEDKLLSNGKNVLGWLVPERTCMQKKTRLELKASDSIIKEADAIMSFSCGAGTQNIALLYPDITVLPAVNTVFLASTLRAGHFVQHCSMCGDCVLAITQGLCPQTLCAKSLMNGPCSGSVDGKCETYRDRDCVWHSIYDKLKSNGMLEKFQIRLPMNMKDFSKMNLQAERRTEPLKKKRKDR